MNEYLASSFAGRDAAIVFSDDYDPAGAELRFAWLDSLGLWYDDDRVDEAVDEEDPEIWEATLQAVVAAAQALHEEGLLEHIIGHDVPVLIDAELGNDRSMRELNRLANPKAFHARTDRWTARGVN